VANDESRRSLQTQRKKKPKKKRRRYKYRGSGKCRRCKANNSDRRLQAALADDACKKADTATYAASIAATATKNAVSVLSDLRKYVLKYCDYASSGQKTVLNAKEWMQEAREAQKIAQKEAKRATSACQQARSATSDVERIKHVRSAGTASNDALNAAENAKSRYFLLRDVIDTNICFQDPAQNDGSITIQGVCFQADLAEFGGDMAATALAMGGDAFSDLKDIAAECSDLGSSQSLVSDAKATLGRIKQNQKVAKKAAQNARVQCQQAAQASSGTELMEHMTRVKAFVKNVIDAAERAESASLRLREIASQRDICYTQGPPKTDISVAAICERSDAAIFAADIATTVFKDANAAFLDLRDRALECTDLASGQAWISRAKKFVSQCKAARKLAQKEAKRATVQCRRARKAGSDSLLREYMLVAGSASKAALNAAETAKSRYLIIRNDSERDICSQGLQATNTDINADSVCQNAEVASFGADMASAAIGKGNNALFALRESAMACDNFLSGQDLVMEASQLFKGVQQARKFAANGARRAKQECRKAKQTTSRSELEQRLTRAAKFANDSMEAARSAQTRYYEIQDTLDSSICNGNTEKNRNDDSGSADIEVTYEEKEPFYTGGTQGRETSLRFWVVQLANMLYKKIPDELIKTYGQSTTPDGCKLEGFKVEIAIDAFEQPTGKTEYWIESRSECIKI
jgi:hypothetical protein